MPNISPSLSSVVDSDLAQHRIGNLSERAQDIFGEVESAARAHSGLSSGLVHAKIEEHERLRDLQGRLASAQREWDSNSQSTAHAAEVAKFEKQVARQKARVSKLAAELAANKTSPFNPERIVEFFAGSRGGGTWGDVKPKTRVSKKETADAALARVRADATDLSAALAEVEQAPLPVAEGLASALAEVERRARKGTPNVASALKLRKGRQGSVGWPAIHTVDAVKMDIESLFFWLEKDRLIAALKAEFSKRSDDNALTVAERNIRRDELRASLAELEYMESALIREIRTAGGSADYPFNMSVPAVLLIERTAPEPAPLNHSEANSYAVRTPPLFSTRANF